MKKRDQVKEWKSVNQNSQEPTYIYNYACDKKETSLCALESRHLFDVDLNSQHGIIRTHKKVNLSRSPFINSRIEIWYEGDTLEELISEVQDLELVNSRFKVIYIKNRAISKADELEFEQRRKWEREIGRNIKGTGDIDEPDILLGFIQVNEKWVFGLYEESEAVWLRHKAKPHSYSTSLNTRLARAVVNIAVPDPAGEKVIDPCCGIGTVLVEALSMGIDIIGSDVNPLVMAGARENIAHFGFKGEVALRDIRNVSGEFDTAIIDLPYNLSSVLPEKEKQEMLNSAHRFTKKLVIITAEPIDAQLKTAGFQISDRCEVKKRNFTRQIIVCQTNG